MTGLMGEKMNFKDMLRYQELIPLDGKDYTVFGFMIDPAIWLVFKTSVAFAALTLLLLLAICGPYYTVEFCKELSQSANNGKGKGKGKGKERAKMAGSSRRRIRF